MRYGHIAGNDKPVSRIVQGTSIEMINTRSLDAAFALFDAAFEQGITAFDSAHQYGEGEAERTLGRWMQARHLQDIIFVLTKGAHHSEDRRRVTPFDITSELYDSLIRLQRDSIDLYLLHRDDPNVPVGPIVEVLNEHHRAGRIRAFGGSNWTLARVQAANAYAAEHGLVPFAASSPHFSLAEQVQPPWDNCHSISGPRRETERGWYVQSQMPVFAWSGLAGGFWSGKFSRDNLGTFSGELDQLAISSYASEDNFKRLDRVRALAQEKGVSVPQLAIAYSLNQPLNLFVLIGHQTAGECRASNGASEIQLTQSELDWLDLKRPLC